MINTSESVLPYWRLSSFYFFYFCVVGAISPFWPSYLADLGYSAKEIGVMTAVIMATRLIAPNFWSYLADKSQQRLGIVRIGCALACVIFTGVFVDQRFWWLLAVVCGYTFFWHAVLPQFEVITLGYLDKKSHRYSQIRLWGSIGFIAAVVGLGALFDAVSIRYLPVAIFIFLLLIFSSSFGLSEPSAPRVIRQSGVFKAQVLQRFFLCFLLASFLLQLSHGPYYTFYTLHLVDNLGYSRTAAGFMWALGVAAEVIMFIFAPRLLSSYSLKALLLMVLAFTTLRWSMIGLVGDNLGLLITAQLFHAWSFAVAHSVSIELVRRHFQQGTQSQGQALYSSLTFGAGGAIGALVSGLIWAISPQMAFMFAAVATAIAFVVVYLGMKTSQL